MDLKQIKAIEKKNKEKILQVCPDMTENSGIYFFLRKEGGFKYAYIGQAKHLLSRVAGHLMGYQHIDLSLKKHKLWSKENPTGWEVKFIEFPESQLDEKEQYYILLYANAGYQLRNKTSGGQGQGKSGIDSNKSSKTYYDGLEQGKKNARKEIAHLFDLHLDFVPKRNPPTVNQQKALQKLQDIFDSISRP